MSDQFGDEEVFPVDAGPRPPSHKAALEWITANPTILNRYEAGTWLALDGPRVAATGSTTLEAANAARREGVEDPLLYPVLSATMIGGA